MPIGVPKVLYRLPGEEEEDWIDLYNCLYRQRMLFLCQELDDEIGNQLISLMLYLNEEDPEQALFLYINSPGGSVTCGIGMYDIMRHLNSGITTICMGLAASMSSFILAGGTFGRRISFPNARLMIHQPEGGSDGQASEIVFEAQEVLRIRRIVGLIYSYRTGQSVTRIAQDMDRDQFMSAEEAHTYGLIDMVAIFPEKQYETLFDAWDRFTHTPQFLKQITPSPEIIPPPHRLPPLPEQVPFQPQRIPQQPELVPVGRANPLTFETQQLSPRTHFFDETIHIVSRGISANPFNSLSTPLVSNVSMLDSPVFNFIDPPDNAIAPIKIDDINKMTIDDLNKIDESQIDESQIDALLNGLIGNELNEEEVSVSALTLHKKLRPLLNFARNSVDPVKPPNKSNDSEILMTPLLPEICVITTPTPSSPPMTPVKASFSNLTSLAFDQSQSRLTNREKTSATLEKIDSAEFLDIAPFDGLYDVYGAGVRDKDINELEKQKEALLSVLEQTEFEMCQLGSTKDFVEHAKQLSDTELERAIEDVQTALENTKRRLRSVGLDISITPFQSRAEEKEMEAELDAAFQAAFEAEMQADSPEDDFDDDFEFEFEEQLKQQPEEQSEVDYLKEPKAALESVFQAESAPESEAKFDQKQPDTKPETKEKQLSPSK